jgi:hypothetical protein
MGKGCGGKGGEWTDTRAGSRKEFDRPRSRSTRQDKDTERAGSPARRFPRIDSDSSQTSPDHPRRPPPSLRSTRPCSNPDLAPETRTRRVSFASIHGKLVRALPGSRTSLLSILLPILAPCHSMDTLHPPAGFSPPAQSRPSTSPAGPYGCLSAFSPVRLPAPQRPSPFR